MMREENKTVRVFGENLIVTHPCESGCEVFGLPRAGVYIEIFLSANKEITQKKSLKLLLQGQSNCPDPDFSG